MKIKFLTVKKKNSGFTLVELIVCIIILIILISITLPSVAPFINKLSTRRLDAEARTIYTTAQNRLSKLRSEGRLKELYGLSENETENEGEYFAVLGNTEDGAGITYRGDGDSFIPVLNLLCPASLFEDGLKSGSFVIEYNSLNNTVTEVFYSSKSFDYNLNPGSISEHAAKQDWSEWRIQKHIGYYGSDKNPSVSTP